MNLLSHNLLRPSFCLCFSLCLVSTVVLSTPARAQSTPLQANEKAAKKACSVGEYQKGVDILADLYLETNDPTYIFNQGRCYQQNEKYDGAVGRFREYLRKAVKLPADERAVVDQYIKECESQIAKLHPTPTPVAQSTSVPSPPFSATEAPNPSQFISEVSPTLDPMSAEPGSDRLSHRGRFGAFVRMDVGLQVPALVIAPGLSLGIGDRVEVLMALLLGNYLGFWAGGRAFMTTGRWKVLLSMGIPTFLVAPAVKSSRGFSYGVQGGGGLQWDFSKAFGAFAELTVAYFPEVDAALRTFWVLPTLGIQGRL